MPAYRFITPVNEVEWAAYHAIRKHVLFDARGRFGVYNENHPDEYVVGHYSKLLLADDDPVGVVRVDVTGSRATLRRVAIRADMQRRGHGRVLLESAVAFAGTFGCLEIESHVAVDAVEFYLKCGFSIHREQTEPSSVLMTKTI